MEQDSTFEDKKWGVKPKLRYSYGEGSNLIFGMDYKMNFNTEDLIKENAIIDAMLKILIKAEKTSTRIYGNFVGEINDLK